jgi:hypothetical protein
MNSPEFTGQLMFGSKRSYEEIERALRAARSLLAWIDGEENCEAVGAPHLDVAAMAVDGLRHGRAPDNHFPNFDKPETVPFNPVSNDDPS